MREPNWVSVLVTTTVDLPAAWALVVQVKEPALTTIALLHGAPPTVAVAPG